MVVDDQGVILFANREAERSFGYGEKQLEGMRVEQLIAPALHDRHVALREHYLTAPQARQMGAGRHLLARRADGTEFPVEVGLNPVRVDSRLLRGGVRRGHHRAAEGGGRRPQRRARSPLVRGR